MIDGNTQLGAASITQPRILFKPNSWLAKIDFINHLILFNNVLITVLSEKMGGKTTFSTLLQNNLDQQIKYISTTVEAPCNREAFINTICSQLHLNHDEHTDFELIARQVNERKAHVLLIIDEAQNLPESMIKELLLVIKGQEEFGFLHICLVSDYSLVATLNELAVEQFNNLIHTIEIGLLSESETRTYVLQRAMTTRLINRPLTDSQFKQFFQLTKGNLSKINHHLEDFVIKSSTQKKGGRLKALNRLGLVAVALFIVGTSYFYVNNEKSISPSSGIISSREVDLPKLTENNHFESIKEESPSYIASLQDSSIRQLVQFELPKKQDLDGLNEDEGANTVAVVDKVVYIPTVKLTKDISKATVIEEKIQSANIKKPKQTHESVNVISNKTTGKYTIQLVASHKISDIDKFRTSRKMLSKTKVRHFRDHKGVWYILTLGEYTNREQAQHQISKLPVELAKMSPWIRPLSGLKNVG